MERTFEQLQHKRISDEIVGVIVDKIHSGTLMVGQKLPSERVLAEELCVSRVSLREALNTLECMGYLYCTGGGAYVNAITLEHVLSPFSAMMSQDKRFAADIIEVRLHLEAHTARLAAKCATAEQLAGIYDTIVKMREETEQGGAGFIWDDKFHNEIAKASNNRAFAIITELCSELLAESRRATLSISGQPAKTIEDHIAIYEAIRSSDEQRAADEMTRHLDKARLNLAV